MGSERRGLAARQRGRPAGLQDFPIYDDGSANVSKAKCRMWHGRRNAFSASRRPLQLVAAVRCYRPYADTGIFSTTVRILKDSSYAVPTTTVPSAEAATTAIQE